MAGEQERNCKVERVLSDGVVTDCALRQLNESLLEEEENDALLNGQLSLVCTYPEGYKERQSIFSCLTCQKENGKIAGICFGCSEHCHPDHELIQLYTKRYFSCDCGNSKFSSKCKLFEEKLPINRKNKYNHNFQDEYCTCNKSYPPPEDDPMYTAEMHQCIMCEDWFHSVHLGLEEASFDDDVVEIVCIECVKKFPFLLLYADKFAKEMQRNQESQKTSKSNNELNKTDTKSLESEENLNVKNTVSKDTKSKDLATSSIARKDYIRSICTSKIGKLIDNITFESSEGCYLQTIKGDTNPEPRAIYFASFEWRVMLCRCTECMRTYEDQECEFLLDVKDSLHYYISKNAAELEKTRENPEQALFREIEMRTNTEVAHSVVAELAVFKRRFRIFLDDRMSKKDEVTAEDVENFFSEINAKRRRTRDPSP